MEVSIAKRTSHKKLKRKATDSLKQLQLKTRSLGDNPSRTSLRIDFKINYQPTSQMCLSGAGRVTKTQKILKIETTPTHPTHPCGMCSLGGLIKLILFCREFS